ncbi:DUF7064 domain-containing protein [Prescottella agglutinans]|uniref:Uncharacterized protein n=1 Tax=Prescottella agglutinans TaxID=1644129 RepID=A0ABT6M783_9NOCA|nr:hypothetical protein [Prescottella agglutinans]MDH6280170.1 hypothetical protein [Prescottella agglutinans]
MKPVPLDEFPVHQSPLSMARVASTDRNFYDRNYFNAHDRTGDVYLISGFGVYPNLGVVDAFVTVRHGDSQVAVRFSDAFEERSMESKVGGYRLEVIEPLQKVRLICEHEELSCDITWDGSFPAVLEEAHILMSGPRPILDASRFAQVGSWSGTLSVGGHDFTVDPQTWMGTRDRSWGIRPVGEPDPQGRMTYEARGGHYWTYAPLRFDDFALMVIVQESQDGHRTLNHATRVFADGRVEQLGWPRVEVAYRSGTRHPETARIHLTTPSGEPLVVDVENLGFISLSHGAGYGGDPDWTHGEWRGENWSSSSVFDTTTAEFLGRLPFSTIDHVAKATIDGQVGWGMFEHAVMGRHDPSGFEGWLDVAP